MNPFKGTLTRKGFWLWLVIEIFLGVISSLLISRYDKTHSGIYPVWFKILAGAIWLPLYILILIRRLQNIKQSPLWVVVGFVPLAGLVLWGVLLAAPTPTTKK